jgi:hypothetical protein
MENQETNKSIGPENSVLRNKLKTEKKKGTRNGALIAGGMGLFVLILSLFIFSQNLKKEKENNLAKLASQEEDFNNKLGTRDSTISDWMMTFNQIEDDLGKIKEKESILNVKPAGGEYSKDHRNQILQDIRLINTLLDNDKKKIASLTAQLNSSGGAIKGMQTKIASLEKTITAYESSITDLKETLSKKDFEIGQLNSRMTEMDAKLAQKDETITNQNSAMNKAYLVSGTYRELKAKGIVSKEGGFLGLGRTGTISKDVNNNLFASVDIRDMKSIDVNAKNVRFITKHPSNSYKMIRESDNKISKIEIEDPDSFWKLSRYAVVELVK